MWPVGIYLTIGLLIHLAEKRWPLRSYETSANWAVDAFAILFGSAATVVVRNVFSHTLERLPHAPGFAWISATSEFVANDIPWPVAFVVSIVALDFLLYFSHRLLHTRYLWHTHAAHHSSQHLYWFSGLRTSPIHVASQLFCGVLLGLLLPVNGGMTGSVAGLIVYACIQHFNHANLNWRFGRLEWLFVVSRYHHVHHGADPKLNNSNFGFLLTIWDRMFGTYTNPDHVPKNFPLGLNYDVSWPRLFIGLPPRAIDRSAASAVEERHSAG